MARLRRRYSARSSAEASKWRITAIEITRSSSASEMPRTPMESRPLNTRTSVTGKRMHWPFAVVINTSSCSVQVSTDTMPSPSSSFMAILPLRFTCTKSESLLRRIVPLVVANTTSSVSQLVSSSGNGRIEVIRSPCSSGSMLTSALPRACGAASGRRQTLVL